MNTLLGTTGLILNEPLIWEKGKKGRIGYSLPHADVDQSVIDETLLGEGPDFPDLSEIDIVRHYTRLSQWNFGVDTGMYALGSCTMKYNPKINEKLAGLEGFANAHPLLPPQLAQGALRLMFELQNFLAEITGLDAVTLQPAAGAQGELAGMLILHAYYRSTGRPRTKILIPDTAHGTNPASAALCGFKPIPVRSDENGLLSAQQVSELMDEDTAGIMITNPNTLGFFEKNIKPISQIIHAKGGQVYCDGANFNAVLGIADMGAMGVDVMHLNLHKTFSTPHGGGGPGSGPVCVKAHLEPFLPIPRIIQTENRYELSEDFPDSIGKLHAFYGNFGVMIKAYCYILSMGPEHLRKVAELAVLNANYIKESLKGVFHLAYDRPCMHECVFSDKLQKTHGITTLDIAKRLMDYGFHPPTIYFPLIVDGALMVEPTETESLESINEFIQACRSIAQEAIESPEKLKQAPVRSKVRRLDEVAAARRPTLAG